MDQTAESKPRALVVDDSRLMRVAAKKILKEHFEIEEAADGEIAWNMIQEDNGYAVVMSDLSMPNLDGLGLLGKIRESDDPVTSELPVVIVTGAEDDTAAKEQALNCGASDFITKPFDSVQLVARAKAGVRVHFIYDEVGSNKLPPSYLNELRAAGIEVTPFNTRKGKGNRFQLNFRNHRKIVVVDGKVAWIGPQRGRRVSRQEPEVRTLARHTRSNHRPLGAFGAAFVSGGLVLGD